MDFEPYRRKVAHLCAEVRGNLIFISEFLQDQDSEKFVGAIINSVGFRIIWLYSFMM